MKLLHVFVLFALAVTFSFGDVVQSLRRRSLESAQTGFPGQPGRPGVGHGPQFTQVWQHCRKRDWILPL